MTSHRPDFFARHPLLRLFVYVLFALTVLYLATISLRAQNPGTPVSVSTFPPRVSPTMRLFYDGTPNLIYVCFAAPSGPWANNSVPATFSWTRAATTLTSIVVSSNVGTVTTSTAHGLAVHNPATVSGSTTSALNGAYQIQTVPSTTTFTITTSGVSDGTYNTAALVVSTTAPRDTAPIWAIEELVWTSGNNTSIQWAGGSSGNFSYICANHATIATQ